MPALKDQRQEAFAQLLAKGTKAAKAYTEAGYQPNQPASSRLARKAYIVQRVTEICAAHAQQAIAAVMGTRADAQDFTASAMFQRLEAQIIASQGAGDYKTAMYGRELMLRCFGYFDSPTKTHQDVHGVRAETEPTLEHDPGQMPKPRGANVVSWGKVIEATTGGNAKKRKSQVEG